MPTSTGGLSEAEILGKRWADRLRRNYAHNHLNEPLERIIEIAEGHEVVSVLVERRYIDPDYRSQHTRFYAATFRPYPAFCDRLHFFTRQVPADLDLAPLVHAYRGYSIMRPTASNPVGRTMITPPADLGQAVCVATEEVHPFGYPLTVTAMPFISQDQQYLRCAHAAQRMVLYHSYLARRTPRRLPEDIHDACRGGRVVGRQLPSEGLSPSQMLTGLQSMHMSCGMIDLPSNSRQQSRDKGALSLFASLCRYVNSQMPPIVISKSHAWTVVGYRQNGEHRHDDTTLYCHDDSRGPYLQVDDPWNNSDDPDQLWEMAITPVPERVFMSAERAEPIGEFWLRGGSGQILVAYDDLVAVKQGQGQFVAEEDMITQRQRVAQISDGINNDRVQYRTYAIRSHLFKERSSERVPATISNLYRRWPMPGYVWVVEAVDRTKAVNGEPCVLGEVIIDPTAHHETEADSSSLAAVLAFTIDGMFVGQDPDTEEATFALAEPSAPYPSGCPAFTWRDRSGTTSS